MPVNPRFKSFLNDYGFALVAPLVALLVLALLEPTSWVQRLENLAISLRFRVRAPYDPPADPRLMLVGIDQQSLDLLGEWPWPRSVEADFLKSITLSGQNPRTVAFDLLLINNYDQYHELTAPGAVSLDQQLADAAGLLPSVITGAQTFRYDGGSAAKKRAEAATLAALQTAGPTQPLTHVEGDVNKVAGSTVALLPVAPLRAQSLFGFVDDTPSSIDGVHYVLPMIMRVNNLVFPSFALQALGQILHVDTDHMTLRVGDSVVLRNSAGKTWTIPVNDKGEMEINYRNPDGFQSVNFGKLFESFTAHAKEILAGRDGSKAPIPDECNIDKKAILIGQVVDGGAATDIGPTPLQARAPLVYTHFNAINDVLRNDYLRPVPWGWVMLGYLLVSWGSLFALRNTSILWSIALPLVVIVLYAAIAVAVFWIWSIEIAMAWPMLAYYGVLMVRSIRLWYEEARGRQQVKGVFARMLSPEVMNHVLDNPSALDLGGTKREVTILFSDIRDYTKISENIEEEELVRQLNAYFGEMVDCVLRNRGTLHKFIGDAVMAVWGDIASSSQGVQADARAAVSAALEMRERLVALNVDRTANGLLPLRIGIGLNHGEVLAGQIGAAQRSEFTVIGDAVNAASRLEGMTKEFHTDLAIGESVADLLDDSFLTRRLGRIQLKGKKKPMMVYEVLGRRSKRDTAWTDEDLALYHAAFERFLARDFVPAAEGFVQCAERHPKDSCVQRYLQAARDFNLTPPTEDWDGRVVMETK
jgi:adenylate cyclase